MEIIGDIKTGTEKVIVTDTRCLVSVDDLIRDIKSLLENKRMTEEYYQNRINDLCQGRDNAPAPPLSKFF